ncbi:MULTISPECIES: transposase [Streptomyces]|uniref:Transposase n=1 Tax=Streptomyces luteosporeus TaxID=173856 RepID=A0ABN3TML4_9ACTN
MLNPDLRLAHPAPRIPASALRSGSQDAVLAELSSTLFTSLTRSDQCRKGMQYIRGLLRTPGRKSVRNIAATLAGEQVSEQNLHHFISASTWDWVPLRRALAHHLTGAFPPRAWVVRTMIIPKTGRHSVGVDKHYFPNLGQVLNAQRAVGVWAASEDVSAPVNWRLHLPKAWLKDDIRRSQVSIPDAADVETLTECVIEALRETSAEWELPLRPVVLDACEAHTATMFERLGAAGVPLLMRIRGDLLLDVADAALPVRGRRALSAQQIMGLAKDMRRPLVEAERAGGAARPRRFAAAVRVGLPPLSPAAAAREQLVLLGVGEEGGPWPGGLWLTNLTTTSPASLARLTRLTRKVDQDFTEIADRVGIRDFTGRSFGGWHRHVTLASAAHAVVALANGS